MRRARRMDVWVGGHRAGRAVRVDGAMRIFDGPDEVHLVTLGRAELSTESLFEV
jgi:hypothetical protein